MVMIYKMFRFGMPEEGAREEGPAAEGVDLHTHMLTRSFEKSDSSGS